MGVPFHNADRKTPSNGLVGFGRRPPGLRQLRHAWFIRQAVLESRANIEELSNALVVVATPRRAGRLVIPIPDSGKIGFAVGRSRRGSGKIGLAVRRSRDSGSWILHPLRR